MRAPSLKEFEKLIAMLDAMAEVIKNNKDNPEFKTDMTEEKINAMRHQLQTAWDLLKLADRAKKAADAEFKAAKKKRAAAKKNLESHIGNMDHKQN
jgi:hypothetical protein